MILQNGRDDAADVEDNDVKETRLEPSCSFILKNNWPTSAQTDPIAG